MVELLPLLIDLAAEDIALAETAALEASAVQRRDNKQRKSPMASVRLAIVTIVFVPPRRLVGVLLRILLGLVAF